MPTISLNRANLFKSLKKEYTEDEFDELCFEFGLELDEVTSEREMVSKEQGSEKAKHLSDAVIYKIDVPANRYDLLCMEGLTRSLMIFKEVISIPKFQKILPESGCLQEIIVKPNAHTVRPFVVGAVLRDITLTQESYASFIDLQDKLHQNLCRKRTLVAIGTHDLDTVQGPFVYDAQSPDDIHFTPLNQTKDMSARKLMDFYAQDSHLRHFLPIIRDKPLYPVIRDANGRVLSLPPIINGHHSRLRAGHTRNILIECTATDLTKARVVLDTLVTMFSEYCARPFSVEPVRVTQADGGQVEYPDLATRHEELSLADVRRGLGVASLTAADVAGHLSRMALAATPCHCGAHVSVAVPPTRHDVLHAVDLIEDVAIAYGYDRLERALPPATNCAGRQQPRNQLSELLRGELAAAGFTEVLTFALCARDDVSSKLRRGPAGCADAVHIGNPKSSEFQVARTSLLPGILKTVAHNRQVALPLRLFEVQDVVLKDAHVEVGARNERRVCAVSYSRSSGFEVIHGLLDRIMQLLQVPWLEWDRHRTAPLTPAETTRYRLRAAQDPTYLEGRCAEVLLGERRVGLLGVLHPDVVTGFSLNLPCSALELNLEPFV